MKNIYPYLNNNFRHKYKINFYHFDHFESEEIGKYKKKTIKIIDIKTVMMTKMSMANDVNVK